MSYSQSYLSVTESVYSNSEVEITAVGFVVTLSHQIKKLVHAIMLDFRLKH